MMPADLTFEDIAVGDSESFERTWTEKDLNDFAALSGNTNPLHTDEAYAAETKFGSRIMYGMHIAIICSTFVGMYIPGKRCLCLRQDLTFKSPVYIGETTKLTGTVKSKSTAAQMLDIALVITKGEDVVAEGTMKVQVLP